MESVDELTLEFGFPGTAATTIAAAGIGQKEELAGVGERWRPSRCHHQAMA
jgi:hypothetical protein